jgi:membrane protein DedA with SNARE-associated domain
MSPIIEKIVAWALALIAKFGYGGIFFTMMLESAAIPIPSEVVLPFSGFLASSGKLNLWLIVLIATAANIAGAVAIYTVGFLGGRPLVDRYGKYFLINQSDVRKLESWSGRYEAKIAFFSRLLPGVRTFSSLIIGVSRINFKRFVWYTLLGSLVWNLPLVYIGYVTGNHWDVLRPYFQKFELVIGAVIIVGLIWFVWKHIKKKK